jgi:hypothetical protein
VALCVAIALVYRNPVNVKRQRWWRCADTSRNVPKQIRTKMAELYKYLDKPWGSALGDDDLPNIQRFLNDDAAAGRQLAVYGLLNDSKSGLEVLFRGEPDRLPIDQVNLLFVEDHCALITNMLAFKGKRWRFCNQVRRSGSIVEVTFFSYTSCCCRFSVANWLRI